MTDIELLPLPEWTKRDDAGQNMVPSEIRVAMADYARAVAEHNVKARDAEIEALRAEVAEWKASYQQAADSSLAHAERAERLAEALREIAEYEGHPRTPIYSSVKKSAIARAALRDHDKEGRND